MIALSRLFARAIEEIRAHKVRTLVTAAGLAIGTMTTIAVATIFLGLQINVRRELGGLGERSMIVLPKDDQDAVRPLSDPLEFRHVARILKKVGDVIPYIVLPPSLGSTLDHGGTRDDVTVVATTRLYADVFGLDIRTGQFLPDEGDVSEQSAVIVVSERMAENLRIRGTPIGQEVVWNNRRLTVIGVIGDTGQLAGKGGAHLAYVPYGFARETIGDSDVPDSSYLVRLPQGVPALVAGERIRRTLDMLKDDLGGKAFEVVESDRLVAALDRAFHTVTLIAGGISTLSVFVGGIGVLNVAMLSVKERSREIGLDKALGATRAEIVGQVLLECLVITVAAGAAGVVTGYLLGNLLFLFVPNSLLPPFPALWGFASLLACGVIGLAAGAIPATRAADIDPIEALHNE